MSTSAVLDFFTTILVIVAIIVISFFVIIFVTRRYDELKAQSDEARDKIREMRKARLALIDQAISMFGTGNPHFDSLSKLAKIYRNIDSEQKEVAWEEKYITVMKKFMMAAKKGLSPNMQGAWQMANEAIKANEMQLDSAREAYAQCQNSLSTFESGPQGKALQIGQRILDAMRSHAKTKAEEQVDIEAQHAGITDEVPENARVSMNSSIKDQIARGAAAVRKGKGENDG